MLRNTLIGERVLAVLRIALAKIQLLAEMLHQHIERHS